MGKKSGNRAGRAQRQQARKVYVKTAEPQDAAGVAEASMAATPRAASPATTRTATNGSYTAARPVYTRRQSAGTPVSLDYSYVKHDLKRLGVVMAIIALVMVALTFVLR